jgi:hypothetical protein
LITPHHERQPALNDGSTNVGQVQALLGIEHSDRRRPAGVRPQSGRIQSRRNGGRRDRLGRGLRQQQPSGHRREVQLNRSTLVNDLLPVGPDDQALFVLGPPSTAQELDHTGVRRWRPLAPSVLGGPSIIPTPSA